MGIGGKKTRSRSLSVTAFKRKKTSNRAEVQLLASVWRFITMQRGEAKARRWGREQKVECQGGESLRTATEGGKKKRWR